MVVLVQKEVAQNMTASPGKMGLLSVATQLYGSPRIVASVPPGAFRPAPKVTSALVRIDVYPEPALKLDSIDHFFRVGPRWVQLAPQADPQQPPAARCPCPPTL